MFHLFVCLSCGRISTYCCSILKLRFCRLPQLFQSVWKVHLPTEFLRCYWLYFSKLRIFKNVLMNVFSVSCVWKTTEHLLKKKKNILVIKINCQILIFGVFDWISGPFILIMDNLLCFCVTAYIWVISNSCSNYGEIRLSATFSCFVCVICGCCGLGVVDNMGLTS